MPFAAAKLPTFALRHRIRSDLPPRGGIPSPGTKREREISSIGGQQCHIVRSVRVRIASGRHAERVVVPSSLRRGRKQGLEELEYLVRD